MTIVNQLQLTPSIIRNLRRIEDKGVMDCTDHEKTMITVDYIVSEVIALIETTTVIILDDDGVGVETEHTLH